MQGCECEREREGEGDRDKDREKLLQEYLTTHNTVKKCSKVKESMLMPVYSKIVTSVISCLPRGPGAYTVQVYGVVS